MKKTFVLLSGLFLFTGPPVHAAESLEEGLHWLYHLQYDKARTSFETYIHAHPEDPAGYFYLTAASWWHLAQDIEYNLPEIQSRLESETQNTIAVAKKLYETSKEPKEKARAALYWGGAEGLWGRRLVTQKDWVKAYFAGKRGYKMLRKAVALDPELYDAYMGLGIYDYYTDTLSGVQAVLAAMLIGGDKERGLKNLQIALEHGKHAKVEAMCFLVEIYTSEENTPDKALPLAESLHKQYPQSPAMQLILMSTLYSMKDWNRMLPVADEFLRKSLDETPWFSHKYVLPARYCIGVAKLFGKQDLEGAESEMNTIIKEADTKSRWLGFARLRLGNIHDLRKERDKALMEYRGAMTGIDLWGLHKEAAKYLRQPFTFSNATDRKDL